MSDHIRPDKILAAREAIARGALDTPEALDIAARRMIDEAVSQYEHELRMAAMDDEFQRMTESDR